MKMFARAMRKIRKLARRAAQSTFASAVVIGAGIYVGIVIVQVAAVAIVLAV